MFNKRFYNKSNIKKCTVCGISFVPYLRNGIPVSKVCNRCLSRVLVDKTKKKPKQKSEIERLENILWTWFSRYIRLLDSFQGGFNRCYTCGVIKFWKDCDAGHYIKRSHHATKFDERNVKPQCKKCNRFGGGNQDEFAVHLIKDYGEGILQELNRLKNSHYKFTIQWLEEKIKYYKEQVKKLKDKKL